MAAIETFGDNAALADVRAMLNEVVANNSLAANTAAPTGPGSLVGRGTRFITGQSTDPAFLLLPAAVPPARIVLIPMPAAMGPVTLNLDGSDTLNGDTGPITWDMTTGIPLVIGCIVAGAWLSNPMS